MQFMLSHRSPSLPSVARALLTVAAVAFGFLLIASNAGGQTGGDDHGNTFGTATLVELGTSVEARIDPGDDRDVFKIDLSEASGPTDLWVYTRGDFDTYGGLYDSSGTLVALNDDGFFAGQIRAFSIRSVVHPGVYYVIAVSYLGRPGDYTLHAQSVTDPGSTMETAKPLVLGSSDGGRIDTPGRRGLLPAGLYGNRPRHHRCQELSSPASRCGPVRCRGRRDYRKHVSGGSQRIRIAVPDRYPDW